MTIYGYALVGGIALQLVACLMSGDDASWVLQACIGLVGIALMIVAFHHMAVTGWAVQ
jgi:hypothetical protein